MKIALKEHTCLVFLAMISLLENNYGQSTDSPLSDGITSPEQLGIDPAYQWTLVPAYSWSFFNKGRDSWQEESLDLYYYLEKEKVLLGTSIEIMHRPPSGTDIMYGLNASWYALDNLELHGGVSLTQDADFLPSERYSLGLQYRLNQDLGLLFDVEQLNFGSYAPEWEDDGITQIIPGISYWFTDNTYMTFRYTHGWVHDQTDIDCYSAKVNFGDLPRDGQLSIGVTYGTDPDLEFGTNGTTLSDAYTFSIFYKEPIKPNLTIFAGLEYVYRFQSNSDRELYQMWIPTIGLSWKF
jgi:YaiO family outer membrane protein